MNDRKGGMAERERALFACIHQNGPATKSRLADTLSLPLSTLNRSMRALEERGLIRACGCSDSSGGRKPAEYDVAPGAAYVLGVDLSRTYTQAVLADLKNHVAARSRFAMDAAVTPQVCTGKIADALERMCREAGVPMKRVLGIGVGAVGPMNRESGVLLHPKGFENPAWGQRVPLGALLEEKTGLPCAVENGANAAALLEYWFGAGRGRRCVAYLHCGVGIRSAVVQNGAVLRTLNDGEDAFARMAVEPGGGRLEDFVSLESVCSRYRKQTGEEISYGTFFFRASRGDTAAVRELALSAEILGMGIGNLARLLGPELVLLSGPLVSSYEPYFAQCAAACRRWDGEGGPVLRRVENMQESVVALGAALTFLRERFL